MPLNRQSGNMYPFVTHTWNPLRGCAHDCTYCYVRTLAKRYGYSREPRFVATELETRLGTGNFIFVCSTADLFGNWVPSEQISAVLEHCRRFDNTYLFQSKDPARMSGFVGEFPKKTILGTTIETNRDTSMVSTAPATEERARALAKIPGEKMVSIEPVLDLDVEVMVKWIRDIAPRFVSIGADSKGHGLEEPSREKVLSLIASLRELTEVRVKPNLRRIVGAVV
jgi:DNA repair photolyase